MPRRRANRRWANPSRCGGSRAAAADADVAVLKVEQGPGLLARLRTALEENPDAIRLAVFPSPLHGALVRGPLEIPSRLLGGSSVAVLAVPITDTCKEVVDGYVRRTIPRDTLADARGPWMFTREALTQALDRAAPDEPIASLVDLCRAARVRVRVLIAQ